MTMNTMNICYTWPHCKDVSLQHQTFLNDLKTLTTQLPFHLYSSVEKDNQQKIPLL
jgi:hypothetical protein